MAEASGEGGAGSEGVGIEAAIAGIESAAPGSISMGIGDISGTAFDGGDSGFGSAGVPDAISSVGASTPGFGSAGVPDALDFGGAASRDMGLSGSSEGGMPEGGGMAHESKGGPAPEKPKAPAMRDEALLGPADRRRRAAQRADAASVTLTDNDAYLLGGTSAKRKDARRTLLGP